MTGIALVNGWSATELLGFAALMIGALLAAIHRDRAAGTLFDALL